MNASSLFKLGIHIVAFMAIQCSASFGNHVDGKNEVYKLEELDKKPRPYPRRVEKPYYSERDRRRNYALAVLNFTINANGEVHDINVERVMMPDGVIPNERNKRIITEAAINEVQKWKFSPGIKDDKAVSTRVRIPIPVHPDILEPVGGADAVR